MYIHFHISKYIAKYLQYIIVYLFLKGMEWNNKFNHVRLVKKKKTQHNTELNATSPNNVTFVL